MKSITQDTNEKLDELGSRVSNLELNQENLAEKIGNFWEETEKINNQIEKIEIYSRKNITNGVPLAEEEHVRKIALEIAHKLKI